MNDARPEDSDAGRPADEDRDRSEMPEEATEPGPGATDAQSAANSAEPPEDGDAGARVTGPAGGGGRRGSGWITALALLLALAAAGAAGALGWRLHQLEQRVAAIPDDRASALEPYLRPDNLQPLRARVETLEAARADLTERLGQRLDRVEEALESVRATTERHQIGWRLAEIRYLISVAVRRLTIAYDVDGAEAALSAADDAVAGLRDVRLIPLRKALVEDLGAVRAVQPADIEGIALRLQSLLGQVDQLPRARLDTSGEKRAPTSTDNGWLQRLRDGLADFVVVRRRPGAATPPVDRNGPGLAPAEALTLALEDAHRAALARDQQRYRAALQRAVETLEGHHDPEAGATARFRKGLAELGERTVDTELPDLTDTLELARRLSREVEQARTAAEPVPGEASAPPAAED